MQRIGRAHKHSSTVLTSAHVRLDLEAKFGANLAINIVRDLRDDVFAAQFDDVSVGQILFP